MGLNHLNGKKVLFISPEFFGIDKKLINVLTESGCSVKWINERAINNSLLMAISYICPYLLEIYANKFFKNSVEHLEYDVDYILVVKGDMISKKTIIYLRNKYPNAKIILYLWDSVKNIKGILKKVDLYDKVYSFEPDDCKKYNFIFRPLFCDIEIKNGYNYNDLDYDICFYGTMYGDRFRIVSLINDYCNSNEYVFYKFCYLRAKFMCLFYWITNKYSRNYKSSDFSFVAKSSKSISEIVNNSKAILDINDINQKGLTIRTLETLLSGRKIITTNTDISNYDLYDSNNVFIIDRDNVTIDKDFFKTECVKLSDAILKKYTAEKWVEDVFVG